MLCFDIHHFLLARSKCGGNLYPLLVLVDVMLYSSVYPLLLQMLKPFNHSSYDSGIQSGVLVFLTMTLLHHFLSPDPNFKQTWADCCWHRSRWRIRSKQAQKHLKLDQLFILEKRTVY
jgi:hypothetical protein